MNCVYSCSRFRISLTAESRLLCVFWVIHAGAIVAEPPTTEPITAESAAINAVSITSSPFKVIVARLETTLFLVMEVDVTTARDPRK
jgi:hypothetical protein